jgi:flagellar biosynthesis activator protein FlaF
MYQLAYAETADESPAENRRQERRAIAHSIALMETAREVGPQSRETIVALNFLRQLWTIIIEDLASAQNGLPPMLRAQIISIGLSILRQAEDIRLERNDDFGGLIEVSRLIMEGLT